MYAERIKVNGTAKRTQWIIDCKIPDLGKAGRSSSRTIFLPDSDTNPDGDHGFVYFRHNFHAIFMQIGLEANRVASPHTIEVEKTIYFSSCFW